MIRIACTCGNGFELPDDEAGGVVQCTRCGRLNDIPNHSDLLSLAPDGTYSLDAPPAGEDPDRMEELQIVYSKTKLDADGNEIDLRTLPAGSRATRDSRGGRADDGTSSDHELDLMPAEPARPARPRYDPETGELVREIDFRRDPEREIDPSKIPMAKAAIDYASGHLARRVSPMRIATELFMPMNLAVMSFMVLMHLFNGMMFVASVGLIFLWPFLLIFNFLILGHYGNVIDDTGRNEHDSLPRPMRDLSLHEDLWSPFVQMLGGLMLAYGPPVVLASYLPGPRGVWMLLAFGVGTVFAPAILLTTNTSGATNNLRPDRVLAVMRIAGGPYVAAVALWGLSAAVYAIGWFGFCLCLTRSFDIRDLFGLDLYRIGPFGEWLIVLPALVAGVYLMHHFAWFMGLIYRSHHDQFPWVLQRHIRDPNKARPHRTHADRLKRKTPDAKPAVKPRPATAAVPVATATVGNPAQPMRPAPVPPGPATSRGASADPSRARPQRPV